MPSQPAGKHGNAISYRGARVAVFGAAGFIGRHVVRALSEAGASNLLVVRDRSAAEDVFARYAIQGRIHVVDLEQPGAIDSWIHNEAPSVIFNLAGYGVDRSERDERKCRRMNADLVGEICEAAAGAGARVVHTGSALEYGNIGGNLEEHGSPRPDTLYGCTKLQGTLNLVKTCRRSGVRGISVRLFTVYGPGEHETRLLPSLLRSARERQGVSLSSGGQRRDFTFVEDVSEGLLRLGQADWEPGSIVNLATGELTSVRAFCEVAARILGIPAENLGFGRVPTRADEMAHDAVSIARLLELTQWQPSCNVAEGIRRTIQTVEKEALSGR